MTELKAQDVHRLAYNTLLYSKKDSVAEGRTLWIRGGKTLRVTAFDDWFALTDHVSGLPHKMEQGSYAMDLEGLKLLEKELRDDKGKINFDDLPLEVFPRSAPELHELWMADQACFPEGYLTKTLIKHLALSPDRLRRLSLIKPGGFPIDCAVWEDSTKMTYQDPMIVFKCGPTVRGAMAPVNREDLRKIYTEEIWTK